MAEKTDICNYFDAVFSVKAQIRQHLTVYEMM